MATTHQTRAPHGTTRLTLEINGKSYRVRPLPDDPDGEVVKAFRLTPLKDDGTPGDPYDVWQDADGIIHCTCPSYEYRHKDNHSGPCKHGRASAATGLLDPDAADAEADPSHWPSWADTATFKPTRTRDR